jgi:hypothetical protein
VLKYRVPRRPETAKGAPPPQALMDAQAELHIYASGGHGFGLRPSDKPCSTWPQRAADWLKDQGFLKPAATP